MNRRERRAAQKKNAAAAVRDGGSIAPLLAQASELHRAGRLAEAEALCGQILATHPEHARTLHLMGAIARDAGRFEAALVWLGKACAADDRKADWRRELAAGLFAAGHLEESAAHCRRAVALSPRDPDPLDELGNICAARGQIGEAVAAFEKALALRQKARPSKAFAPVAEKTPSGPQPGPNEHDYALMFVRLGAFANGRGDPERAVAVFRRALALVPDLAEAHNGLGSVLLMQGKRDEAAIHLERALALAPELYETYGDVLATFFQLFPAIGDAVTRAAQAWPTRLDAAALLGPAGVSALADNAFLRRLLESHTVCDLAFERFLTALRPLLAAVAERSEPAGEADAPLLGLCCALARQCFLNDYVFALTPEEAQQADRLRQAVIAELDAARPVAPLRLAALASYVPLGDQPSADRLLGPDWPAPLAGVIAQQIAEPRREREFESAIPRLTEIADATSAAVRRQYEESPYPRWVEPASQPPQETVRAYLRRRFPSAMLPGGEGGCDMLIAGCGTGRHPVEVARRFSNVRILALDLSGKSLAYALRKSRELGLAQIDYAQADILELGTLERRFDAIDAGGVLHHLADPFAGWRILWSLLREGGSMRVALYSALARRDIDAARSFVAERGFAPTPDDIRRCREELLATPLRTVAQRYDFFSTSECRDLLFHVQEQGLTLPAIRDFLTAAGARMIGFELPQGTGEAYRTRFPDDPAMTDLDHWHAFEQDHPDTFAAMYQFWIAKN
ncbi:MAG: tetratricopeptide repeat protein [Rhodoplanes sp.]